MTPTRYEQVRRFFLDARDLPPEQRGGFLARAAAGDPELAREVERLLAEEEDGSSFLNSPVIEAGAAAGLLETRDTGPNAGLPSNPADDDSGGAATSNTAGSSTLPSAAIAKPGTQIGPYRILRTIGEGGMGTVYEAEQRTPITRKVALKVVKWGMDTREVIARFESERQALALMDHANIARVLDAGATESGRPYFVMELVKGEPITKYCDVVEMPLRERLELFMQVCHAVQHAHTKGVIHRDIKSSNVLVALADGKPAPKVIDFGIAKATSGRLTDKTVVTQMQQIVGTPAYMSPEQAELTAMDIDTRSDIYSLGVLLYELLTGVLPFDPVRLRSASLAELQRIIRNEEPPTPSSRILTLGVSATDVASRWRVDPQRLRRTLKGDLDWIAMRCLEKDRSRRYETASALEHDIQRYMTGKAVVAAPPSTAYRFKKFVRRNKGIVTAGAAVAAALLIGVIAFAWQAEVAKQQRNRAIAAESETTKRADELQKVSDFQAQMLAQVDPTKAGMLLTQNLAEKYEAALARAGVPEGERGGQVAAFADQLRRINRTDAALELIDRTILKPAVDAIEAQFADQPIVDATLRQVLADRYRDLGLYEDALPLQELALSNRRRMLGEEHLDTLISIDCMAMLLMKKGEPAQAEPFVREALEKRRRIQGDEHPDTLTTINNMGHVLLGQRNLSGAESHFREALETRERVLGKDHSDTLFSIDNMGFLLAHQGKNAQAEPYLREALDGRRRSLGNEHPDTLTSINNLGNALQAQGKLGDAETLIREALTTRRRVLGDDHPDTLFSIANMGALLMYQNKPTLAEPYLREALDGRRRSLGNEHLDTLTSINNLGFALQKQGKLIDAEQYYREALETRLRILGEDHPDTLFSVANMGLLLWQRGDAESAERYFRQALAKRRRLLGNEHQDTLTSINNLGYILQKQKKLEEAEPYFREALATRRSVLGEEHPDTIVSIRNLGTLLTQRGNYAEAEALLLPAEAVADRNLPLLEQARFALIGSIVDLYAAWEKSEPGKGYEAKSAQWRNKLADWQASTQPAASLEKGEP